MNLRYFWLITLFVCRAVTASDPDGGLISTDDMDTKIEAGDFADRKRLYETFRKPASMDMHSLRDVQALVQALGAYTDNLDARKLFPDKRAFQEVKTMAEMLRSNADKLDNLTGSVNLLIDSEKVDKTENLCSSIIGKLEGMNADQMKRLDNMNPLFVSMFVMLADISFATSLRLAKHEDDMRHMLSYFRNHINTDADKDTLNKKMTPVFQWYTGSSVKERYTSCLDYLHDGYEKSGEYMIFIPHTTIELNVYCDQETDDGGWLVFQRRQDGSENFFRDWATYKKGFGKISSEFWLGNDNLNLLTRDKQELRVDLEDFNGNTAFAKYSTFAVGAESEKYKLTTEGYNGTAVNDALGHSNGRYFSTSDRDNSAHACIHKLKGAWWYYWCANSNLNGMYYTSAKSVGYTGVYWQYWKNNFESLKKTEMKIRPKQ